MSVRPYTLNIRQRDTIASCWPSELWEYTNMTLRILGCDEDLVVLINGHNTEEVKQDKDLVIKIYKEIQLRLPEKYRYINWKHGQNERLKLIASPGSVNSLQKFNELYQA